MFNRIKRFIVGTDNVSRSEAISSESACPPGYHIPLPVDALILPSKRQVFLQQLNDNHALPAAFYRQCYLAPLFSLPNRVQSLPALNEGPWAYSGAFGDLTVQFTAYAVRLAKGRTLPPRYPVRRARGSGITLECGRVLVCLILSPALALWVGRGAGCWDLLFREGHFAFDIV